MTHKSVPSMLTAFYRGRGESNEREGHRKMELSQTGFDDDVLHIYYSIWGF